MQGRKKAGTFAGAGMSNALIAFDLATVTGWAWAGDGELHTGTFDLRKTGRTSENRHGAKFSEFVVSTTELLREVEPQMVYYEDAGAAARRKCMAQTQLWFGWRALLLGVCYELGLNVEPVNTSTYKKEFGVPFRCGKDDVILECQRRGVLVTDENEADAVAILNVGLMAHEAALADFRYIVK
jgi:hypothetical protein